MKTSKYNNTKTEYNGISFDSKKEAKRFADLQMQERCGVIHHLKCQVKFELIPKQMLPVPVCKKGSFKYCERPIEYVADFVYIKDGKTIVEDVKGMNTREYNIKRKLMLFIHGIQVMEV